MRQKPTRKVRRNEILSNFRESVKVLFYRKSLELTFFGGDESAKRHILDFRIQGEPFICNEWEYVELRVVGQSFMIHQI